MNHGSVNHYIPPLSKRDNSRSTKDQFLVQYSQSDVEMKVRRKFLETPQENVPLPSILSEENIINNRDIGKLQRIENGV